VTPKPYPRQPYTAYRQQAYQTLQGRVEKDRNAARAAQDELAKVLLEREMQLS
jgi:hypothetical protein